MGGEGTDGSRQEKKHRGDTLLCNAQLDWTIFDPTTEVKTLVRFKLADLYCMLIFAKGHLHFCT